MKKIVIIAIALLLVATGMLAFWQQTKSDELDELVEITKQADANYEAPAEEVEASQRLKKMEKKYPAFFDGGGMTQVDFDVRTELGSDHKVRLSDLEQERNADADKKWAEYQFVFGARDRLDEYFAHRDSVLEKDLQAYISNDLEKMELFDEAVKYCESDTSIKKYVAQQSGTENYLRQLEFVLYNAEDNLCSKL